MATVVDPLSQGDPRAAHQTLEAYLSKNYAAAGSYNPAQNTGLFIDHIDTIRFSQWLVIRVGPFRRATGK